MRIRIWYRADSDRYREEKDRNKIRLETDFVRDFFQPDFCFIDAEGQNKCDIVVEIIVKIGGNVLE